MKTMKGLSLLVPLLCTALYCIEAGGIREYKGQPYMVTDWAPTNVQNFIRAGSFDIEGIKVGPEDSKDGVFKNGVYYWGGPVCISSNILLQEGLSFRFRLSDNWQSNDRYNWMVAKYTGENMVVSKTQTYTAYGTISFVGKNGKALVEIVYLEPYTEESYLNYEATPKTAEAEKVESIKRVVSISTLPLGVKAYISLHNINDTKDCFASGTLQWDSSFTDTWQVPAGEVFCTALITIKDDTDKVIRALSKNYVRLDQEVISLSFNDFEEEPLELLGRFGN